jgi:hypothetical protein
MMARVGTGDQSDYRHDTLRSGPCLDIEVPSPPSSNAGPQPKPRPGSRFSLPSFGLSLKPRGAVANGGRTFSPHAEVTCAGRLSAGPPLCGVIPIESALLPAQ